MRPRKPTYRHSVRSAASLMVKGHKAKPHRFVFPKAGKTMPTADYVREFCRLNHLVEG